MKRYTNLTVVERGEDIYTIALLENGEEVPILNKDFDDAQKIYKRKNKAEKLSQEIDMLKARIKH